MTIPRSASRAVESGERERLERVAVSVGLLVFSILAAAALTTHVFLLSDEATPSSLDPIRPR